MIYVNIITHIVFVVDEGVIMGKIAAAAQSLIGVFDTDAFDRVFGPESELHRKINALTQLNNPTRESLSLMIAALQDILGFVRYFRDKGSAGLGWLATHKQDQRALAQKYGHPILSKFLLSYCYFYKQFQGSEALELANVADELVKNMIEVNFLTPGKLDEYNGIFSLQELKVIKALDISKPQTLAYRNDIIKQRLRKVGWESFQEKIKRLFEGAQEVPEIFSLSASEVKSIDGILRNSLSSILPKDEKSKQLVVALGHIINHVIEIVIPENRDQDSILKRCFKEDIAKEMDSVFADLKDSQFYRIKDTAKIFSDLSGALLRDKDSLFTGDFSDSGPHRTHSSEMDAVFDKYFDKIVNLSTKDFLIDHLVFNKDANDFRKDFYWSMIVSFDSVYGDKFKKISKVKKEDLKNALYGYIDAHLDIQLDRVPDYKGLLPSQLLAPLSVSEKSALAQNIANLTIDENKAGLRSYYSVRTNVINNALLKVKYNLFKEKACALLKLDSSAFAEEKNEDFFYNIFAHLFPESERVKENTEAIQSINRSIEKNMELINRLRYSADHVSEAQQEEITYFKNIFNDMKSEIARLKFMLQCRFNKKSSRMEIITGLEGLIPQDSEENKNRINIIITGLKEYKPYFNFLEHFKEYFNFVHIAQHLFRSNFPGILDLPLVMKQEKNLKKTVKGIDSALNSDISTEAIGEEGLELELEPEPEPDVELDSDIHPPVYQPYAPISQSTIEAFCHVKTDILQNRAYAKYKRGVDGKINEFIVHPLTTGSEPDTGSAVLRSILMNVRDDFLKEVFDKNIFDQDFQVKIKKRVQEHIDFLSEGRRNIAADQFHDIIKGFCEISNTLCETACLLQTKSHKEKHEMLEQQKQKEQEDRFEQKKSAHAKRVQQQKADYEEKLKERKQIKQEENLRSLRVEQSACERVTDLAIEQQQEEIIETERALRAEQALEVQQALEEKQTLEKEEEKDRLEATMKALAIQKDKSALDLWSDKLKLYSAIQSYLNVGWFSKIIRKIKSFFKGGKESVVEAISVELVGQIERGKMLLEEPSLVIDDKPLVFNNAFVNIFGMLKRQNDYLSPNLSLAIDDFSKKYTEQLKLNI